MLKKYFDWTPSDIAQWEKIRAKGLPHFVLWYGVQLFGGGLFIFLGGAVLLLWVKAFLENQATNVAGLLLELLFVAAACLSGGVINSLITWAVEERIYRKLMAHKKI